MRRVVAGILTALVCALTLPAQAPPWAGPDPRLAKCMGPSPTTADMRNCTNAERERLERTIQKIMKELGCTVTYMVEVW